MSINIDVEPHEFAAMKRDADTYHLPLTQWISQVLRNHLLSGKPLILQRPLPRDPWVPKKKLEEK